VFSILEMNIQPLNPVNWKKNRIVKHVSEAIRARGLEEELEISSFTDETSYAVLRKKDGSKKSFVVVEGPMRDWVAGLAKDLGCQLISLHLNAAAVNILDAFLRTDDAFLLNSEGESPELREELEEKMPLCIERIGKLTGRLNSLLENLTTAMPAMLVRLLRQLMFLETGLTCSWMCVTHVLEVKSAFTRSIAFSH
jgi:hypothetical protein